MSEHVLVADPNTQFLDATRDILEGEGYRFTQAVNGEEAKLKIEEDPPDYMLANYRLDYVDGPSLVSYLRDSMGLNTPVAYLVELGAEPIPTEESEAVEGVLMRPLRRKELLSCLRSLKAFRRLMDTMAELGHVAEDPIQAVGPGAEGVPFEEDEPTTEHTSPEHVAYGEGTAGQTSPRDADSSLDEGPLYPMRWFKRLAVVEVKRAIRFSQPLSLLLMAYDFTEEFLDECPPETLDHLSSCLARAVKGAIREIDLPVNFSRDHILVLLPNTDVEGAIRGASRTKEAVAGTLDAELPLEWPRPTVSIGATTSPTQGKFKFTDLLRDATRALREARAQGGDSVFYS